MNIPVIFQFLKELSANNNREWFNAHREQYENARNEFENLLTVIISRISLFDESIRGIEALGCRLRDALYGCSRCCSSLFHKQDLDCFEPLSITDRYVTIKILST